MPLIQSRSAAAACGDTAVGHHRLRIGGGVYRSDLAPPIFHPSAAPCSTEFPSRKHYQDYADYTSGSDAPPLKRRRSDDSSWDESNWNAVAGFAQRRRRDDNVFNGNNNNDHRNWRPDPVKLEDGDVLVSRDEIERCSPSRKDGIDSVLERQLRYSYCLYIHNMGIRLQLPHATVATAVVLCHRFFFRRSHACHDRHLIATAAVFLAAKSEETPCLLNSVLRASCQVSQDLGLAYYPYLLHADWFPAYRERVTEAEQMILTTLDFELDVKHPYVPLTSVLNKLGLSQTALVGVAWNLISEGLRSSLWLQFKPHHIAAGAAFLAAKFLNYDLAYYPNFWQAFNTTLPIVQDVVQQLMELF